MNENPGIGAQHPAATARRSTAPRWLALAITACLGADAGVALAQSAAPGATELELILVAAPENLLARRLDALAGGADLVSTAELADTANPTLARALATSPGVVIQSFFGGNDQPRVQIRGSGLQQNPVERGVLALRDGLPINRADGSYVVGFANPAQAESIEVYRGYLANRLGASVLGGAFNFISPTGASAPGTRLMLSGGSFGQLGASSQFGWDGSDRDLLVQADVGTRKGFRDYNDSRREHAGGNLGFRLGEHFSVRVFADYTDLGFDVSGPLTAAGLRSDPRSVFAGPTVTPTGAINPGPNVIRDRPRRDAEQTLLGSRLSGTIGAHVLDLALGHSRSNDRFRFPVSAGIRTTDGDDSTGVLRYAWKADPDHALPLFETTAQYVRGSADRGYFLNRSGHAGERFGANQLEATTFSVNAGFNIPLADLLLSPSIAWSEASRDNVDVYTSANRPTLAYNPANPNMALPDGAVPAVSTHYARAYRGWSPALALSWQLDPRNLLFAALSRSFEPPTHDDLLATVNGTPNSSAGRPNPANPGLPAAAFSTPNLAAQRASTLEFGWRGSNDRYHWDAIAYYSKIRDELLSLRDESGASLGAVNAGRTRHAGIEVGLGAALGERLSTRLAYTWQDFRFVADPLRGNNRLAGAPPQSLYTTLDYRMNRRWSAQASVRWTIDKTPVDNFNSVYADAWAVFDLRSRYRFNETISMFAELTNLFDKRYASSTLIVDQARADQAAFMPGDGRGLYAGLNVDF
ncbi:MAG TPA: TonB-dependent receptor [Dokdonella sp.]|uniref:TonB-dependent receptor family protein n=7 Tax=Dokdonella sp. TaxID=2291710 RepID=UPI002CAE0291|nr:TonB-dependent receptor [Xanthomonadales bacterium]HQW76827.1 TonB-dependent receptor [Dokdonella sp.]MBL0223697.1 TonB-dependent receptor [Xanthomonadales bacterium]HQX65806.1 TonB-dependent receptor [Dokdonella sp.]HQY55935.1 TonB-dependent receptor [Dokdonella sp.]